VKRRIVTGIATSTVAAALVVVGGATAAQAAVTEFCSGPFSGAGFGCFYSTGDKFKVADNYADGHRAVLEWETDYGSSGECHDANGAGNGYVWCDYDLRENQLVWFKIVAREGANGKDLSSTNWVLAYTSGR
jgi:hypothetical protein